MRVFGTLLTLLLAGCGGDDAGVPDAVEVANIDQGAISGRGFAATEDGFALAWAELPIGGEEEQLVLTWLDPDGRVVRGPTTIMGLGSHSWHELDLVSTPSGSNIWYWRGGTPLSVVVLDLDGDVLAMRESEERLDGGRRDASMAPLGDAVAVAYRNASEQIAVRIYGDQGLPRAAALAIESGSWPEIVAADDHFELVWDNGGNIRRASIGVDGTVQRAPETIASDPDVALRSAKATWVSGGLFIGFLRGESFGDGAGFRFVRDDGTGWSEPRILFPPNRLESLDIDVAGHGDTAFVLWQGDADSAVPRLMSGTVDLTATARVLEHEAALTPEGIWAGGFRFAEHAGGVAAVLQTEAGGARQIYFRRFAP